MIPMNPLQQQLREHFGFDTFREGQEAAISRLIAGKSVLAIFPTGGGKSICYQLPGVLLEGLTVVISPLIALMKDQLDFLVAKGAAAARLDSTLTKEENRQLFDDLYSGKLKLLYISPERLGNERFIHAIARQKISLLAIDEAHCISEWGHNFRPDYLKISQLAKQLKVERVLALTATATPQVAKDVREAFGIAKEDEVHTGFYRPNLELNILSAAADDRKSLLLQQMRSRPAGATIVYVTLQKTAEELADYLTQNGCEATAYHAGLKPEDRTSIQDHFMQSPDAVIVATIAFGMGVDKADIRYIYHYNLPKGLESYSQEIGRAGRDGKPSVCEMLACPQDVITLENFSYGDTPEEAMVEAFTRHVLNSGEVFDVSEYELSGRFDMRPLVVKTLLTYLEIEGCLVSTGSFYSEYKFQPQRPLDEIVSRFEGERAAFLSKLFSQASKGTTWMTLDMQAVCGKDSQQRDRIVKALGYLEEKGELTVQVAGVRQGYRRLHIPEAMDAFLASLNQRFQSREINDIERIQKVMQLARQDGCVTRHLLQYFGEARKDCGHCNRCHGTPPCPTMVAHPPGLEAKDREAIKQLMAEGHESIQTPRQLARFFCGISSPATTRSKLRQKTALFAAYQHVPFKTVLQLVKELRGC
jgi:ATP-dependent DNA helicase RecQ